MTVTMCSKLYTFFYLLSTIFCVHSSPVVPKNSELILVSVIFRHGARTTYNFYPKDPNINETFYPMGLGGLTNEGKLGEYKLGRYLRQQYGSLIGDDYTEEKVYVRSTDITRTRMSAQLVLAGLFPPSKVQTWNKQLMWQPIPVIYRPANEEDLFHPSPLVCSYKEQIYKNMSLDEELKKEFVYSYKDLYKYVEENSGRNMTSPMDMLDIYFIIRTEKDMNLTIPSWVDPVFPQPMLEAASKVYKYQNLSPQLKQLNCGYMLKKIIGDSRRKIVGKEEYGKRRIYLYSGHETTIGYMLDALNITVEKGIPPYGSALSFELHRIDDDHFLKLRYRNDTEADEPVDLQIKGCETLCPLDRFEKLVQDLLPTVSMKQSCNSILLQNRIDKESYNV